MLKKILLTSCMLFMAGNAFAADNPHVVIDTSFGEIELELAARTSAPDSATMQFFINHANNDSLNHSGRDFGYAVFAKVVRGMDVVDQIAQVRTANRGGHQNVPSDPIIIKTIKRLE